MIHRKAVFGQWLRLRRSVMREMVSQYMKTRRWTADGKLWAVPSQEEFETAFICISKMVFLSEIYHQNWHPWQTWVKMAILNPQVVFTLCSSVQFIFFTCRINHLLLHLNALLCHYGAAVALSDSDNNMGWTVRGSNPGGVREASLLPDVQTGSKAQPVSHSMFTGVLSQEWSGWGVKLTTHLHLLPHMPSLRVQGQLYTFFCRYVTAVISSAPMSHLICKLKSTEVISITTKR